MSEDIFTYEVEKKNIVLDSRKLHRNSSVNTVDMHIDALSK